MVELSKKTPTGPQHASPIKPDGAVYRCNLCDTELPDGALVHAAYNNSGALVGVLADTDPDDPVSDSILHRCGTLATT